MTEEKEQPKEQQKKPLTIGEALVLHEKNIKAIENRTDILLKMRNKDYEIIQLLVKAVQEIKNDLERVKASVSVPLYVNVPEEPKAESGEESKSENGGEPNGVRTDGAPAEPPEEPKEETAEVPDEDGAEVKEIENAESEPKEEPIPNAESSKYPPEA